MSLSQPTRHKATPQRPELLQHKTTLPYSINLSQLASAGWVSLSITPSTNDPLYSTFLPLFTSSASFLSLPPSQKSTYTVREVHQYQRSEEGYSSIPGEKCMITLRKADSTPAEFELKERSRSAWKASAQVMKSVLHAIEESLGMTEGVLVRMVGPQAEMPKEGEENFATLLRMFRYDRPTSEASGSPVAPRVVAEPHRDLGLLTLVIGHTPGLECWDPVSEKWIACEDASQSDASSTNVHLTATLLVGQTLAKFTNWRYIAGRHRVSVNPVPESTDSSNPTVSPLSNPNYRYSLVHALRAHLPVIVSSSEFTTPITGLIPLNLQFTNVSVADIYSGISASHWNVNIGVQDRRRQKKEVQGRMRKGRQIEVKANQSGSRVEWLKKLLRFSRWRKTESAIS